MDTNQWQIEINRGKMRATFPDGIEECVLKSDGNETWRQSLGLPYCVDDSIISCPKYTQPRRHHIGKCNIDPNNNLKFDDLGKALCYVENYNIDLLSTVYRKLSSINPTVWLGVLNGWLEFRCDDVLPDKYKQDKEYYEKLKKTHNMYFWYFSARILYERYVLAPIQSENYHQYCRWTTNTLRKEKNFLLPFNDEKILQEHYLPRLFNTSLSVVEWCIKSANDAEMTKRFGESFDTMLMRYVLDKYNKPEFYKYWLAHALDKLKVLTTQDHIRPRLVATDIASVLISVVNHQYYSINELKEKNNVVMDILKKLIVTGVDWLDKLIPIGLRYLESDEIYRRNLLAASLTALSNQSSPSDDAKKCFIASLLLVQHSLHNVEIDLTSLNKAYNLDLSLLLLNAAEFSSNTTHGIKFFLEVFNANLNNGYFDNNLCFYQAFCSTIEQYYENHKNNINQAETQVLNFLYAASSANINKITTHKILLVANIQGFFKLIVDNLNDFYQLKYAQIKAHYRQNYQVHMGNKINEANQVIAIVQNTINAQYEAFKEHVGKLQKEIDELKKTVDEHRKTLEAKKKELQKAKELEAIFGGLSILTSVIGLAGPTASAISGITDISLNIGKDIALGGTINNMYFTSINDQLTNLHVALHNQKLTQKSRIGTSSLNTGMSRSHSALDIAHKSVTLAKTMNS